ncbi:MAG: RluA family pseudouridine synthase [Methylotenera sp.]|nr:RluA family pseudouridine synthase [Oligoflexia bacterium]
MKPTWKWTVPASSAGVRADKALTQALEADAVQNEDRWKLSRSQIQKLIDEGQVLLSGEKFASNLKLPEGAEIEIHFPEPKSLELTPEDRPLDILYEDAHLLVVNKPPDLTVHPSTTQTEGTLVHALLHHIKDLSGIGGVLRPGIVHRIDKDTSGALVITKTDQAHQILAKVFSRHEIDRKYWALCYGSPSFPEREHRVESLLDRSPADRKKMSMTVTTGRKAVTYFKPVEEYGLPSKKPFASLIEARLETGRTHQVRVHLTGLHHSILGDPVYGTPTSKQSKWQSLPREIQELVTQLPGQALHARVLGFKHPITGETLHFEAAPPPAFAALLEALKKFR